MRILTRICPITAQAAHNIINQRSEFFCNALHTCMRTSGKEFRASYKKPTIMTSSCVLPNKNVTYFIVKVFPIGLLGYLTTQKKISIVQ
jgi:hypothetical protein